MMKEMNHHAIWTTDDLKKVCIVGLACRLPGAKNADDYWANLMTGKSHTHQNRVWQDGVEGKGGFLPDIDAFDSTFFNISPHEAICMDPQQRQLMEVTWQALESSGASIEVLRSLNMGVFTTSLPSDYKNLLAKNSKEAVNTHSFLGNAPSALSGRISYFYDFNGPAITIDTACSSGLTALNIARLSIESGECHAALVGGVSVFSTSELHQLATNANMTSANQHCAAFDDEADGFVPAEGVVALVVMSLEKAIEYRLHIYGLIDALCLNHGGMSNGLMAPNPNAQHALIEKACRQSNIGIDDIAMIEAHGTGTKLGDLIELKGLTSAFRAPIPSGNSYLGASKTVVGHTLVCSGLASIIKVLLSYQNQLVPPNVLFKSANQYTSLEPFIINQIAMPWPSDKAYAGVSAFGFTGSNAHLVLKFKPSTSTNESHSLDHHFVFSAEDSFKLDCILRNIYQHLLLQPHIPLAEISAQLFRKPKHFKCRVAIYARDRESLISKVNQLLKNKDEIASQLDEINPVILKWLNGSNEIFALPPYHLGPHTLPHYPFSSERYWINTPPLVAENNETQTSTLLDLIKSALAPLLGYKTCDIDESKSLLDLGIDSLTGMQLISALQQHQIEAKIESVWQAPSLLAFVETLDDKETNKKKDIFTPSALSPLGLHHKEPINTDSRVRWVVSITKGKPILLLPPLNSNYLAWLRQLSTLHTHGYQCHIPHYPATNDKSDKCILSAIAGEIMAYLRNNRLEAHLIGWSLGGVISLLIAQNKSTYIKSMSLVSTAAKFNSDLFSKTIEMQSELESYQDALSIAYETNDPIGKHICANSDMDVLKSYYQALLDLNISKNQLRAINVPTQIVYGEKDPVLNNKEELLLAEINNAKLIPHANSGHFIPMTASPRFNQELLSFLQNHESERHHVAS